MKQQELIPHLFRTEYRKIVAVLCKRFGFDQIEIAEDMTESGSVRLIIIIVDKSFGKSFAASNHLRD